MKKKYLNSSFIFTLLLTLMTCFAFGQSNHTVTFTGNSSDFNAAEKLYGGDDVDYYVTFDDTYMYFAAFRVNAATFGAFDHFTVYLDTDPKTSLTSGNGSTTGLNWDNQTPTLPYNADHRVVIRNNAVGESFHHKFTGASWNDQTGGSTASFTQFTTNTALEIRVPIANIDSAKGIYFTMYMSYGGGGGGFYGANDINYPITFAGSAFSGYFGGIGLTSSDCNPIDNQNQPIMDELVNDNPTANTKYAFIDINDNDYGVIGDIAIVSGGSGRIAAGHSLTIDGDFDNDGDFVLESTSALYSSLLPTSATGEITYNRYVSMIGSGGTAGGNDLISLPVFPTAGMNFEELTLQGSPANNTKIVMNPAETLFAFGPYDNTSNLAFINYLTYNGNNPPSPTSPPSLVKGKGYRAATGSGETLTFTGAVETGNVNIAISTPIGGSQWNLIGNPYPSYIDASSFFNPINNDVLDPSATAIYGYNSAVYTGNAQTTGNYTIINLATLSLPGETFNIAPGQGFFVASNATGGDIEYFPTMRTTSGDDDYITGRNSGESNFLKLDLIIGASTYSTSIFFNPNGSLGLDPGYDAVVFGTNSNNYPFYSHLVEENMGLSMAIQAVGKTDFVDVTIPLGVNSNQGEQITFSINTSTLPSTVEVYLDDNVTNTFTLLNSGDYTLTPSTNLNGTGRFYLRVTDSALSTPQNALDNLSIYTNKTDKTVVIAGQLLETTTAKIYDIQGRVVSTSILQTNNRLQAIEVSSLSAGVYVVQLANGLQNKTQKVILK